MEEMKNGKITVVNGPEALARAWDVVESFGIPAGILSLPSETIEEAGIDEESGEVWIKQSKETKHYFKMADKHVVYAPSIRCKMERGRMKNIKGVKAKDLMLWVPVNEVEVDANEPSKIHFRSFGGLSRTFPVEYYVRGA